MLRVVLTIGTKFLWNVSLSLYLSKIIVNKTY